MKNILIRIGYLLLSALMVYGIIQNFKLMTKYTKKAFGKI